MSEQTDRHAQLVSAGWTYDAQQDRYRAPGSDPDTATWYNLDAAWAVQQAPRAQRIFTPDPRRQTPL